jgi:hypothetical protein
MKGAKILLKADVRVNWIYGRMMEAFDVSAVTIAKVRKTFVEQGLEVEWFSGMPSPERSGMKMQSRLIKMFR